MKIDAKHIEEMWGPRCDQYEAGCGCCDMWQMWDEVERLRRELAEARGRLTEIIGYCAQEGHDGEPWDTINSLATGKLQLRVTDQPTARVE